MSDYLEIEPGLVISEDGEIVSSAGINDTIGFLARLRHEAKTQEKEWERRVAMLDMVLLKQQGEPRVAYGDTVISKRGGSYTKTDADFFADKLPVASIEDLLDVISAGTGFQRKRLPDGAIEAYDNATATLQKKSWIESSVARKPAPPVRVVGGDDLTAQLEASVAAVEAGRK